MKSSVPCHVCGDVWVKPEARLQAISLPDGMQPHYIRVCSAKCNDHVVNTARRLKTEMRADIEAAENSPSILMWAERVGWEELLPGPGGWTFQKGGKPYYLTTRDGGINVHAEAKGPVEDLFRRESEDADKSR